MDAAIHARYDARSQALGLQQSYVRMPQTTLNLNGTVSRHSALNVSLHSADLQQLETVAEVFAQPSSPLPPIAGSATFDGTVSGSTAAPQIAGQLNANNLQVRQTSIRSLSTRVQANPSNVSLQNGRVQLAQQAGRITFNIQSALDHWSHTPASEFNVNLSASQLDLAELAQMANLQTQLSGTLNANIAAHGTQDAPIGRGDITLLNANLAGAAVPNAQVRFEGTGTAVQSTLLAQISGGKAQAQLNYYPKQQGYDGTLQATGIDLSKIQVLRERNIPATGTLTLTASGRGTLKDPQGTASLTIPKLQINGQSIDNINFHGDVANHVATFTLGSAIAQTPLTGQGRIALVGDYNADVTFNTPVIPLQPLVAAYAPSLSNELSGETEIHATLQGPLKNKTQLQGRISIPRLALNYVVNKAPGAPATVLHVAAVAPIVADYRNGVVMLQPGEIKGSGTDVRFQGNMPLSNTTAPSTLKVQGGINLAILQAFDPTIASSGQMVFDINAGGHSVSENVEGVIRVVNANIATPDAPMGMANGNGVLTLRRDRVDISTFTADVGGGKVTASGGMTYSPAIRFDIGLKGNDLRVLYPESVRTDFGLDLAMTGTTDAALLQGNVNINSISFTPSFDLTTFMTQFGGVASPPPTGQTFADKMKLAINVRSTSQLNVVSPTVSIQGDANLRAIGTAANPVIVGRADITGGDMIFAGNRYVLQNGTIAFVNSTRIEPVVNLQVTTTVKQYNIAMRFRGPVDRLNTTYNSDPALSQADIIHLVAFGTTEEAANASPSQSSTLGAESLVASQVSSQLTSRLQKALGVSQISLDPQLGATSGNQQQGARLTVRQRVTSKLYVTFSTDVTTTQFSAIQLQYKMNPKWSVSGVRDENGGFSLDGRYHKEF